MAPKERVMSGCFRIGVVAFCCLLMGPALSLAQSDACEGLTPETRVRLSVLERGWSGVVASVISCSDTELVVFHKSDGNVRLAWATVTRVERSRRWDLRWPLFAVGAAAGLWLGSQLPTENEEECDYDYVDATYDCFDRGTAMFLGLAIGAVPGYFGGMFIKVDRWELMPLYGGRAGVLARVSF
jgi:hypothetical protein